MTSLVNRGYQMSVGFNTEFMERVGILFEPLASIILFYSISSINLVMNLHEFNLLFVTYF